MYLGPTEEDRLRVFVAAELARRALARGLKLNRLIDGVVDLVDEIRLEVLLDEGSRLIVLRRPWR